MRLIRGNSGGNVLGLTKKWGRGNRAIVYEPKEGWTAEAPSECLCRDKNYDPVINGPTEHTLYVEDP